MKKHRYRVHFNGGTRNDKQTYSFKNTTMDLFISKNKASVLFEMSVKKTHEEFTNCQFDHFVDAYRKIHLIHAVKYSQCINVNSIEIEIDGDSMVYDRRSPGFPFVTSMIGKNLRLDVTWASIIDHILQTTKSNQKNDLRFSAAYSYIAALSRDYKYDKFANLWTAMNSYYTYIYRLNGKTNETKSSSNGKNTNKSEKERDKIEKLSILIDPYYQNLNLSRKEIETLPRKKSYSAEREITKIRKEEFEDLFRYAESFKDREQNSNRYHQLTLFAKQSGRALYSFLLLDYPYHLRCKYFHGEYALPLTVAYNDYELQVLDLVNYGLQRFLNKEIPKMFADDFWTESKQKTIKSFYEK